VRNDHEVLRLLAARIRKLRQDKGWSQERLAELAGIHRTYLGGIETARRNPSVLNLARIADALDVPVAALLLIEG